MASKHTSFVSSSHAVKVNAETKQETVLTADADGMISLSAGDELRFKHEQAGVFIALNELLVHAGAQNVRLRINGGNQYTWVIPAGESMGISGMPIYTLTALNACTFRYEGLTE